MLETQRYQTIHNTIHRNLPAYLDLLQQMVAINSFTANPEGVNRLGDLTADYFAHLGFTADHVQAADPRYGQHVVLTRHGQLAAGGQSTVDGRPVPKIGLISHLDTVYTATEEEANDFDWRVEGKRIYGPGTCDIKGGTVMIYLVLETLQRLFPDAFERVTWVILLNAAEEALVFDFGELCRKNLGDDAIAALVFEAGEARERRGRLVVARKGMARYTIHVEGKSAHAGASHENGANAIVQLADVIQQVAAFTDYERNLTFNVGTVLGGTVINRVPHEAVATVEMRAFTSEIFENGVEQMLGLNGYVSVHSASEKYPCRVQVEVDGRWPPWPRNDATNKLFALFQAAGQQIGYQVVPEARGGLSDGNLIWDHLPTIDGLGPAGGNAHCSERSADGSKNQEYVLPDSFLSKGVLNVVGLLRLIEEKVIGDQ
jgi:glutamate carboxypeptidase